MYMPLMGKRILVTRPTPKGEALCKILQEKGAHAFHYPTTQINSISNNDIFNNSIKKLSEGYFDKLIITSQNTTISIQKSFELLNLKPTIPEKTQIFCIGKKSAFHFQTHFNSQNPQVAKVQVSQAILPMLGDVKNQRIFLPQSAIAKSDLTLALNRMGALVTSLIAYDNIISHQGIDLENELHNGPMDVIIFTSSSCAENFTIRLQEEKIPLFHFKKSLVACIGPKTAQAALKKCLQPSLIPLEHSLEALIASIEDYYDPIRSLPNFSSKTTSSHKNPA